MGSSSDYQSKNPTEYHPSGDRVESWEMPDGVQPSSRFTIGEEIDHGGMGVVYVGRDENFHRDVAIKILHQSLLNQPSAMTRFIEEARISGQLQHPGIPPVFDWGYLPDDRPFLAMKLIHGETLKHLLIHDRPDLSTLVAIFEQIAQTMAYAHSKFVVHRDLKPENVMVGAYSEIYVMDWGLVKLLDKEFVSSKAGKPAVVLPIPSGSDTDKDVSLTQSGIILGTPEYMPPEQALGNVDAIDLRSDVFSLGAILCELLTDKAPYVGTKTEIEADAKAGNLALALQRLDGCNADEELVRLAKECLNIDPNLRPKDASVVATRIAEYQSGIKDRLRNVEVEAAKTQTKEDESKIRRKLQMCMAFLVFCLFVTAGVLIWSSERAADRREFALLYRNRERQSRNLRVIADVKQSLGEATVHHQRGLELTERPQAWLASLQNAALQVNHANTLFATTDRLDPITDSTTRSDINAIDRQIQDELKICQMFIKLAHLQDENDERMVLAQPLSEGYIDKYEDAFRELEGDPKGMSTTQLITWLGNHPHCQSQLVAALLQWSWLNDRLPRSQADTPIALQMKVCLDSTSNYPFLLRWSKATSNGTFKELRPLLEEPEILDCEPHVLRAMFDSLDHLPIAETDIPTKHQFYRRVRVRYPSDYSINLFTGWAFVSAHDRSGAQYQEGFRYLTVASALRPDCPIPQLALQKASHTVEGVPHPSMARIPYID